MKKFFLVLCIVFGMISINEQASASEVQQPTMMELVKAAGLTADVKNEPKTAILIDSNTGKILWEKNPDTIHNPASIAKLLTAYRVFEVIKEGKFTLETKVTATPRYEQIANIYELSNNKIQQGVSYSVKELIPMMLVPSSNVATIMLAELVEQDSAKYLKELNELCESFGMMNTKIYNATGAQISSFKGLYSDDPQTSELAQDKDNETTARDLAIFTRNLLERYPEILMYTKEPKIKVMTGTPNEEEFESYNYSLPGLQYSFDGVDGLKTGSSQTGAFNIDATAKRGDFRIIAIVLGVGDWADQDGEYYRHPFTNALLKYGFDNFSYQEVLPAGKHKISGVDVELKDPLKDTIKKSQPLDFKLVDKTRIQMKDPLPVVSDKVKLISVPIVTEDNGGKLKTPAKQQTLKSISKNIRLLGTIFIIVLFLIMFVVMYFLKKRKLRSEKQKTYQTGETRRSRRR
ncbi:D-alanyl-D-alanine carboxypeptidase family protein [Vagococcus vulneris]|uniref:Peptidase S11 D-alanyl-D-alanine carboxypeptidase A N-terminal domain-containing protein n=1 Tax=Vagococcus vulneris TaxID=1977869 RepID=A0A429ZZM0_9ENTE|nr:serine hydrolase [Vagococcus vulneris]RST99491.1 hypothetical protein CBF37_03975 [Vagococcus vulneris]